MFTSRLVILNAWPYLAQVPFFLPNFRSHFSAFLFRALAAAFRGRCIGSALVASFSWTDGGEEALVCRTSFGAG